MRRILKKIGRPRGRISEEGICRVGRRVGFENDIDGEDLKEMERLGKVGNRAVTIAGKTVFVEVDMKNHVPREVTTGLQMEGDSLSEMAAKAGEVLFDSLKDTDNLAGFAKGVDWIANIDRLGAGKINGFEALGGIYGSLRRLFDEEVRHAEESGTTGRRNVGNVQEKWQTCPARKGCPRYLTRLLARESRCSVAQHQRYCNGHRLKWPARYIFNSSRLALPSH
jgi:hypothetical protein